MSVSGELSAATAGVTTTVVGEGSLVRWDLVDAGMVLGGASVERSRVRHVAELLRRTGVTVVLHEDGRRLLELGVRRSLLGRALFGTSAVRPRALRRLLTLRRQRGRQRSFQ